MPTYHVHYFGLLADRRGKPDESLVHPACTAEELFRHLFPSDEPNPPKGIRAAVNDAFVSWDRPLAEGDRIAFMPPMSGG